MSSTPLSDSREVVERSLFHSIRKELVDKGYLPDIELLVTAGINLLNQGAKQFRVTGNVTAKYTNGRKFTITLSTGNNATYTIVSSSYSAPNTTITVVEVIPNSTADGQVNLYYYYDDAVGIALYAADIVTVINTKGFAIEVFGASNSQAKYLKKVPRIVILPNQSLPGGLGGSPDRIYTPVNGDILAPDTFVATVLPPQTTDYSYDICLVSDTAQQARVLHGILALGVPKRGYVKYYNDPTNQFFVVQFSYRSIPDVTEGIIEDIYMYEVRDIFETESAVVSVGIKPIVEIDIDTNEGTPDKSTAFNTKVIQ